MKRPAGSAALARVLDGAAQLSRELGSVRAGTEHLLLALAQEQLSPAGRILDDQGAQCRLLRQRKQQVLRPGAGAAKLPRKPLRTIQHARQRRGACRSFHSDPLPVSISVLRSTVSTGIRLFIRRTRKNQAGSIYLHIFHCIFGKV